jgi:SecD/SecF fusion protein
VKITTSYLVNDESTEADQTVEQALIAGVSEATGQTYVEDATKVDAEHFSIAGSSKVGATIADDIKTASAEAMIFSIIAIFIYILIRFKKWQFSLGAILALVHDTLFVIAAFAIARLFGKAFEIDQVFIAAILTIIGYSINDTVVVFDRIRENLAIRPHEKPIDTFNLSINNTMNRTLITSFTTLIVVLILLIFGGEVLRGFSFALFIGIVVGTYSSIFIATPSVLDLGKSKYGPRGDS